MIEAQLAQLQGRLRQALDLSDLYARIEGLEYGASFRGLREIWTGGSSEALGRAALPDGVKLEQSPCGIHPALLDACWQVGSAVLDGADPGAIYLPMHIGRVTWGVRATGEVWSHVLRRSLDREHGTAVLDVRVFDALGRLVCDVEGLTLRASSAESLASAEVSPAWLSKHGYRLSWKPTPLPEQTELAEQVVIFTDRGGVGQALLGRLEQAGCRCKSVPPGALDALDRAGCEALLANLCVPGQQPVSIVYLCGLDAQEGAQDWERSQALVYGFPLLLVQALSSLRVSAKLCLASRGAHAVGDAGACVWQSTLTGLCRVLASEHPEYCVRHVDLDPVAESDELCAARLFSEAYTRHDETQTAYRGGVRHVARLTRIPADLPDAGDGQSPCALPRSDGSYLVSGGLGWLGLHSARWLLEHGAGQVVLFGRNPPEGDARAALQQLHGLGGQVTVRALDVSDATAVQRLVDELQAGAYPVRGVVHAAGVLRDAVVVQQSWSLYQEVFKPKALGAWNLHAATERLALDFFVLYSSVTSLFGAPGQANYAASNAFLDALAHHRRAHGLPALSVDWGPWSGGGMALQASRRSRRLGFSDLAPRQGLAALAELLRRGMAQAAVVPIRWPALLEQLGAVVPPLLADWASAAVPVELLHDTLLRLPADQRHARCAAHATLRVRSVLGLGANDALPATQRFNELGLDSLMAAELRNDLARDLALTLSATVAFEYPTIESLSDHLFSEWTDVALRRMLQPESSAADVHAAPFEEMVL
jgi:acyl carrier protein